MCVRERERDSVCVFARARARACVCVCVCEGERERERSTCTQVQVGHANGRNRNFSAKKRTVETYENDSQIPNHAHLTASAVNKNDSRLSRGEEERRRRGEGVCFAHTRQPVNELKL